MIYKRKDIDISEKEVPKEFNKFFTGIAFELSKSLPQNPPPPDLPMIGHSLYLDRTTNKDVLRIIEALGIKHSSRVDNISNMLVKKIGKTVAPFLADLINRSFCQGLFPKELSKAKVIPLHKSGSRLDTNTYRPISL